MTGQLEEPGAVLYRVIQPVRDLDEAAEFYARVFGTPGKRISNGRHYFDCGGTLLACYDAEADGDELGEGWRHHPKQYLYFSVANLEATLDAVVDAGGTIEEPIAAMPWGERMFYARDPSGNPISFVDETTVFRGSR